MHWDIYTGAAVISGATLILVAAFGGESVVRRLLGLAIGFAFIGYGIYVSRQTSGTYYFPVVMFIIPVVRLLHFGKLLLARSRGRAQARVTLGAARPGRAAEPVQQQPAMLDTWRGSER